MKDISDRTYYELLGVDRSASVDEIRQAYREIARIYHPDSNFYTEIVDGHAEGEESEVFKSITAAYQVLISEDKRKEYDATLPGEFEDWGDEDGDMRVMGDPEPPEPSPTDPHKEEISEDWKREREYFEQHYSEILRPAPKADLVGREGMEGDPLWEENQTLGTRFGDLDGPDVAGVGPSSHPMRRAIKFSKLQRILSDPYQILLFIGIPVLVLIIVVETILFL